MLNTVAKTKNAALTIIVKALMPIMHEVYKQSSDLVKAGFRFDNDGRLYNSEDQEFDKVVRETVTATSLDAFREEFGESVETLGYRLCDDGHVVPKCSVKERFLEMLINPLEDIDQLIIYEDYTFRECLKRLSDTNNKEILGDLGLLESGDDTEYLIVAAPWRVALLELYVAFIDEGTAMEKLSKAKPIRVLGMVMMARVFSMHLQIDTDYDWFKMALTSAYLYARMSYMC